MGAGVLPVIPTLIPMCIIGGLVTNIDGSATALATITFNSLIQQVLGGFAVQPFIVSRRTDSTGVIEPISLPQGLTVQIKISLNGVTYPPTQAIVPALAATSLNSLLGGSSDY